MSAMVLKNAGYQVTVLERSRLGSGASAANAGIVSPLFVGPITDLRTLVRAAIDIGTQNRPVKLHPSAILPSLGNLTKLAINSWGSRYRSNLRELRTLSLASARLFDQYREQGLRFKANNNGYLCVYN